MLPVRIGITAFCVFLGIILSPFGSLIAVGVPLGLWLLLAFLIPWEY